MVLYTIVLLLMFCSYFRPINTQIAHPKVSGKSDIYVWNGTDESNLWLSSSDDLLIKLDKPAVPLSADLKRSDFLTPNSAPSSEVTSTNNIAFMHFSGTTRLMPSSFSTSSDLPSPTKPSTHYIFYQSNDLIYWSTRINSTTEKILTPNSSRTLTRGKLPTDYELNCYDIRPFQTKFLLICKYFKNQESMIVLYLFDFNNSTTLEPSFNSSIYRSSLRVPQNIQWGRYVGFKDLKCDQIEQIVFILDVDNVGNQLYFNIILVGEDLKMNRDPLNFNKIIASLDASDKWMNPETSYISNVFNSFFMNKALTTKSCVNNFFIVLHQTITIPKPEPKSVLCAFSNPNIQPEQFFIKVTNESLTDVEKMFTVKCGGYSIGATPNPTDRLWINRLFWVSPNEDYLLRARLEENNNTLSTLTYEAFFIDTNTVETTQKTIGLVRAEPIAKTELSTSTVDSSILDMRLIQSHIIGNDTRVAVACWSKFDMRMTPPNLSTDCMFVDIFLINTFPVNKTVNLQKDIVFFKREYGPFSSLAFDLNCSELKINSMFAFKNYGESENTNLNQKLAQIYDSSVFNYSLRIPQAQYTQPTIGFNHSLDVRIFETAPLSTFSEREMTNGTMIVPFYSVFPTLIDYLTDLIFSSTSSFTATQSSGTALTCITNSRLVLPEFSPPKLNTRIVGNLLFLFETEGSVNKISVTLVSVRYNKQTSSPFFSNPSMTTSADFKAGSFSSSDSIFKFESLVSLQHTNHNSIVIYYQNTGVYSAIRFDIGKLSFSSLLKSENQPFKVFETISKVIIISSVVNTIEATVDITVYGDKVSKALNERENAQIFKKSYKLPPKVMIKSLNEIYVSRNPQNDTVLINIVGLFNDGINSNLVGIKLRWQSPTDVEKTLMTEYVRLIDRLPMTVKTGIEGPKCLFRDVVGFVYFDTTEIKMTVYNLTKDYYYTWKETTSVSSLFALHCADDYIVVQYDGGKTIVLRLRDSTVSYKRIRDKSSVSTTAISWVTSSDSNIFIKFGSEQYLMLTKHSFKFYLIMGYEDTQDKTDDMKKAGSQITWSSKDQHYNITGNLGTIQLLKGMKSEMGVVYIGNETIESQKKIIYDQTQKTTYTVDNDFRLTQSLFSTTLKTSAKPTEISLTDRIKFSASFDKWTKEEVTTSKKVCRFDLRGSNASVVDKFMLRWENSDENFCMEISEFAVDESTSILKQVRRTSLTDQIGTIRSCRLLRDESVTYFESRPSDLVAACHIQKKDGDYLWFYLLKMTLAASSGSDFTYFQSNAIKLKVKPRFNKFNALYAGGSFFFAVHDSVSNLIYYSSKMYGFSNNGATVEEDWTHILIRGTAVEFTYAMNASSEAAKYTGIVMIVTTTTGGEEGVVTPELRPFRLGQGGEISEMQISGSRIKSPLNENVTVLSCAYQNEPNSKSSIVSCAYLYGSSRNVFYTRLEPFQSTEYKVENYTAQFYDLEIRQIKTFSKGNQIMYVALAVSPIEGKKFLVVYIHSSNSTTVDNAVRTAKDYMLNDVIIYDGIELTDTPVDPDFSEISYLFFGKNDHFLAVQDPKMLRVYRLNKIQVTLNKDLNFELIAKSSIEFRNHRGEILSEISLDRFFREKKKATLMWLYVFLVAVGMTVVLVVGYLIFKKKNTALEDEISSRSSFSKNISTELV